MALRSSSRAPAAPSSCSSPWAPAHRTRPSRPPAGWISSASWATGTSGPVPAGAEKNAYNGVESYALDEDGRVLTSYVFREGGFDGPLDVTEPVGKVKDRVTNATWSMRFFWFLSFEYLIGYLDDDYQETIIARTRRDYAWIMTRDPVISDERYAALAARLGTMGYDLSRLRRVPSAGRIPGTR